MELTKEQQEKFDEASTQIYDYFSMAYGRQALGSFMERIEENPELRLFEIYELLHDEDEDEDEDFDPDIDYGEMREVDLSLEENAEDDV